MSDRLNRLAIRVRNGIHAKDRVLMDPEWNTSALPFSLMERKALALAMVMERMPVVIDEDELIVGRRTVYTPLPGRDFSKDPSSVNMYAIPGYATKEEKERLGKYAALAAGKEGGDEPFYAVFCAWEGSSIGHNVAGYENVLRGGIAGVLKRVEKSEASCSSSALPFLRGLKIVYTALSGLITRYAGLAAEQAKSAPEPRCSELLRIARGLEHIALNPPRDMLEAIQLYWMTHLALLLESSSALCFGRLDQILALYQNTVTDDELVVLVGCLIVKMNEQSDISIGEIEYAGNDNLVIGGLNTDGQPGENRVTKAYLEAVSITRLIAPQLSIRLHKQSPDWLIDKVAGMIASGINHIAVYNDEVYVPNLISAGIDPRDARDYSIDLCQDVSIGGRSAFFLGGHLSMAHTLLETIASVPDDISYEHLLADYKLRLTRAVEAIVRFCNHGEKIPGTGSVTCVYTDRGFGSEIISPLLIFSGTCEGTVERGLDAQQGGLKYGHKGINLFTPTNAINSLAAIKAAVYDEGFVTLRELKAALAANFEGYELLRLRLMGLPKWGNDIDYVDDIAREMISFGLGEIIKHKTHNGFLYLAGIHQPYNQSFGVTLRATPDGRRDGEPVPVGISPSSGTDKQGATAVFLSLHKLDTSVCSWNNALSLKFHPSFFSGDGKEKFSALLRAFVELSLMELQVNVLDEAELRSAQINPEAHSEIMVRVWGYSAYFTKLTRALQDEIIKRTSQTI